MSVQIIVDIDDRKLLEVIDKMIKKTKSFKKPFILISKYLLADWAKGYREKKSPSGETWPPNAGAPPGRRLKDGSGEQMVDTGRLRRSFRVGGSDNIRKAENLQLTVGTSVPYYIHHHFGAPAGHLPRRRVMDWVPAYNETLVEIITKYLNEST
jgi:phage gpG-like protein